ncbi:hypothetical protein MUK72_19420 (plasmid) [Halococcus dombrowskii]|jgi:hypothetical protein|uniref:Small CPxCG-related zinc finger protein n=1 Tax=Halococcus dombrowskii TaxID=179637 RepID=A0AAV3SHK6_HALDO|nr:hypothetical protein [Halococcus dombrowskii]UOO97321.1 hypothetical protein MUK72_19420 [Halococcus dombrowskii]
MSTDLFADTDADAEPAFEPRDGEHVESEAQSTDESEPTTDDHDAWKIHCRECSELVPAKPYCYECGAERPADGDYYVAEEVGGR